MRIDERNSVTGTEAGRVAESAAAQSAGKLKGSSRFRGGFGDDSVELSGASVQVRNFETARSARLEQLAKTVQSGNYLVSPALVSRALVGETIANQGDYS